jgi:hypothetical protein
VQGHGEDTANGRQNPSNSTALQNHGKDMEKTRQRHNKTAANVRQKHNKIMAEPKQKHGTATAKPRQRHCKDTPTAWQGDGKDTAKTRKQKHGDYIGKDMANPRKINGRDMATTQQIHCILQDSRKWKISCWTMDVHVSVFALVDRGWRGGPLPLRCEKGTSRLC